jgi:hypothetical protein
LPLAPGSRDRARYRRMIAGEALVAGFASIYLAAIGRRRYVRRP